MNRKNRKTVVALCMILLLIPIASADTLNITAETNETFADNRSVNITINLTNPAGNPINNTRVNFTTNLGILSTAYEYTNESGIAIVNISSWDNDTAKITAEAPNATNATVNVTFVRGPISEIVLSSALEATVNTTCLITATVYDKTREEFPDDESKWRVMPNVILNFTAASPPNNKWNSQVEYYNASISPSSNTTDENGTTTVTLHLSSRAGSNTIDVNATNEEGEILTVYRVVIGLVSEPAYVVLNAEPQRVSANGIDNSQITGNVTDKFLNPLCSLGSICFNVTGDIVTMPLDGVGEATITIDPSKFTGNVTVNGTYIDEVGACTNITNETVVEFYAEEPARIIVAADATKISRSGIPGVNESVITATVIDKWGHVLQNRTLNFSTTLGDLSLTTVITDTNGQATVALRSDTAGNATVTASTLNDSGHEIVGTIDIQVMDKPFISVITTIEPNPVEPGGIINVTTTISGQGNITGTRYAAHAVLALDRSGSMDPDYYAGTPLDVVLVLDRSGSMEFLGSDPEQPMTDAKTAAKVFMDNLVSNAQVGVVSFSSSSRIDIGLTLLNSSDGKALVRSAIDGISATGSTAIGDGLADANNMLIGGRADARKITVLLTDGVCNAGSDRDCSNAIATANANGITIYTIGLGSAEYIDEPLLQRVASETDGRYYNAPSSSELRAVYNSIAQEISDYDITEIEYGTEGFTPYDYEAEGSVDLTSYTLRFDGYDFDTTFTYNGNTVGECLIQINGEDFISIPPPVSGNEQWVDDYEYDLTGYVQNGSNTVTFYDYHEYAGYSAWTSRVRNVDILESGVVIASYPTDTDLNGSGYTCPFNGNASSGFEDTFLINETINDLKVQLRWSNSTTDLHLELTSPGGMVYGTWNDTTGYYFDDREAVSIDLRAPEFDTYITSASPDTVLAGETSFYVTDELTGAGKQACSIMRWKLPSAPTHNARIESVTMYLRGITPTSDPGNEHRSVNIYGLTTSYGDDPTWNCNDSSTGQPWASGSFSSADNDSYLIDSVVLTSSIVDDVVEFNITSANWSGNRLPDWGEECNIVLVGEGYGGKGADRFASSETDTEAHHYTLNGWRPLVTVTYSIPRDTSEYIWIHPLPYTYPDTDADTVENGNWTVRVTGSGNGTEQFNITTHTDKKSAAKLASHAFISSLDPTREDRVGLATYSYSSTNNTANQTSYICEGNQWEGYFTVSTQGIYYFNLTWTDASDLDLHLYEGINVLDTSATSSNPEVVSATLSPGTNYRVVVNGTNVTGNDTQFAINVYSTIEIVYGGTAAFLGTSTTVDIPSVDLNKAFLIVKSSNDRTGSSNANAFTIRGHFIDNDTIEFTRASSSGEGKVSYFVIQADNIEVQSGTTTFANGDSQKDVPITPVADHTTKCFVALSTSSDSGSRDHVCESWVTGELTANNNLRLKRAASGNSQVTVDWFVIHFTDNTTVQTGEKSWTNAHTATQTITSVNTSRTWLYFTSRMTNNGLAHTSIKGEITDSTILTFSKHSDSTTGTDYVRYFVIQFPEDSGVTVQRGTASVSSGDSTVDIGITAVNRERAFAFVTNDCKGTGTAYARPYWISYFTADNNLKMQRWYTGQPVVHKWQVVEWHSESSAGTSNAPVNWLEWRARIDNHLTDSIGGFDPINSSIDSLTADGMTAIDEGLLNANNALTDYENGTIVLMTDGIDNVGYHSMIAEAERAAARNTTIFTVGLGSDIDDGVLQQIANITGGEYYFAPNATVLRSIFVGIAGELGNYTAPEPQINMYIGSNTTIEGTFVNITYVSDSANVTYYNRTTEEYEHEDPSNPNMTSIENRTILSWDVGNRPVPYQITVGKYWRVSYQLTIDNESANSIPVIISPSSITYDDSNGTRINETIPEVTVTVGGDATPDTSTDPATNLTLSHETESEGPPTRHPSSKPETIVEYAYKLTAKLTDVNESKVAIGTLVEFRASSGMLYNRTYPESGNDTPLRTFNETTSIFNGNDAVVWLCSDAPGTITVWAYHTPENGTRLNASRVVTFHSCEAPPIVPPAPKPYGRIRLE